ncbi:hypothetical protein [Clostridium magnum]|uniref:Uncharacterized protein n=1 Tax=Clostridium magnum DSM 2767 TaxID=1121326 RepID=A0A162SPU3_9CLOT|nr:hypothetical protein [Clostridium magnum]KZL91711.1 hypothetical protein CLMAG_34700 [Clostridium magnum DSM 2767]SHJ39131.1 hypothetical protein SAMN02745944_05879 [Clostridium magnum DSM 2767]
MDITEDQKIMLQKIWNILKDRFIRFAGKTRSKDISVVEAIQIVGNDTFKLFYYSTEEEETIANEFIQFAADTIIATKSLGRTLIEVEKKYKLS